MNYPLGHTTGRPGQLDEQTEIVSSALGLLRTATEPGQIEPLPYSWIGDWKATARGLGDSRSDRADSPQYDRPEDEAVADEASIRR